MQKQELRERSEHIQTRRREFLALVKAFHDDLEDGYYERNEGWRQSPLGVLWLRAVRDMAEVKGTLEQMEDDFASAFSLWENWPQGSGNVAYNAKEGVVSITILSEGESVCKRDFSVERAVQLAHAILNSVATESPGS